MNTSKTFTLYRILFLIVAFLYGFANSYGQTETLALLSNKQSIVQGSVTFSSGTKILIVRTNWRYKFWKLSLSGNHATLLDSTDHFSTNDNFIQNESGLFYLSYTFMPNGNDKKYLINYLDTNGVKHASSPAIDYANKNTDYPPKLIAYLNDELYYISYKQSNGTNQLIKNSSGLNVADPVFTYSETLQTTFTANDSIFVVTKSLGYYKIYNGMAPTGFEWRVTLPGPNSSGYVHKAGQKGNETFLRVEQGSNHDVLWKIDLSLTPSSASIYIDSIYVSSIDFTGNSFLLSASGFDIWKGEYDHPENRTKIPLATSLNPESNFIDHRLGKNVFRLLSDKYGIELGKITSDSIVLAGDLFEGTGTGLLGRQDNTNSFYTVPYSILEKGQDSLYAIMTNGMDSLSYLYLYDGSEFRSYFPLSRPHEITLQGTYNGYMYWLRNSADGLKFQRKSLSSNLETQPLQSIWPDSPLTWATNLGYNIANYGFWGSDFNPDYNNGCKLLADGSVITCFMLRDFSNQFVFTSDGYLSDSVNASIIFNKYDKYGKVAWTKSIGSLYTSFLHSPYFEIDSEGNVIMVGQGSKKAYFDSDSLISPYTMNFLAKLNGTNGEVMWKKQIFQSYYSNEVIIEGIALDAENSIYVPILFRNFDCTIEGLTVSADLSPSNALAKFSADGNIDFFKGTPTPWTDFGGSTKAFSYNEATQEILSCQTQGAFNVSSSCAYSDWNYFFQIIGNDGDVKKKHAFMSNDLGSLTTATIHGSDVIGFGYFRGTMDIGMFSETTAPTNSCHANEAFMYRFSSDENQFTSFKTTISEPFYPMRSKSFGDYIYVYGTDKNDELTVIRFDLNFEEIGYLKLGQFGDPFDWEGDQFFDVNDEYLVFFGSNFKKNMNYDLFPSFGYCPYKTVIKTKNEGWKSDVKWFEDEQIAPLTNNNTDALVFPNPFSDNITLALGNFSYNSYELFDLNGKRVDSGQLSDEVMQILPFNELSKGSYLLKLISGEEEKTIKLIKL